MKKFIIRSLVYLTPLMVTIIAVYAVDPYYLFTDSEKYSNEKYDIGYSYDQGRRYKIFTFKNQPVGKIILGASEINIIDEHNIPEEGWHSLSYGGAPLQESLRMYWEISDEYPLTEVLIAPEFIKYYNAISSGNGDPYYTNFKWETSQSAKAMEIYSNKMDYFIDKYTLQSTWSYLTGKLSQGSNRSKPKGSKEAFWKHQMDYAKNVYGSSTVFEDKKQEIIELFKELKKDADNKGIKVTIVIPIQHTELLREEYNDSMFDTYSEYIKMLVDVFGKVYYLAYTESISDDVEIFSDPFHCTTEEPYLEALFKGNGAKPIMADEVDSLLKDIRKRLSQYE